MRYSFGLLLFLLLFACTSEKNNAVTRTSKSVLLVCSPTAFQGPDNKIFLDSLFQITSRNSIKLDTAHTFQLLEEDTLKSYSALILFNIEEKDLEIWHHADVERYVQSGGGIISIDETEFVPYQWHWYENLFSDTLSTAQSELADFQHFELGDYDGGRAARLDIEKFQAPSNEELNAVLNFAIGNNTYDYSKAIHPQAPNFNRYSKVLLDDNIYEPMGMVVLPDLKVLFLERRGKMKLHDPFEKRTITVTEFDVCTDGNYEDGLTGIAIDPDYGKSNHWIYIYYSPSSKCDDPDQYLSRFVFEGDSLHWNSEKVILKVGVQRETCCHSGGDIEFGPDGLLYLSTGDNTSSKESDGYSPIDERPGRAPFDAQKSSANTHDLRGKIIRIKPEADGSYTIPDGNLFAKDGSEGRPEIYAMGCRNPFRIEIDQKTGWLYWGDVGPDVGQAGRYGPESLDEWNQAKESGFFGWPYFMGPNIAFPDRDFEMDTVGALFDADRPVNMSPNNYGSKELPPAKPAWIWYPYGASKEFPLLGTGSRSSMVGPFYYPEKAMPLSQTKFPDYYADKFFIYEWARSWIQVLTLDGEGGLLKMEPFLPEMPISKPIDLVFGPDGALYILEYGNQYFMNNPDAMLSRIEFSDGNRKPIPEIAAENLIGAVPLSVNLSAAASYDFDVEDSLLTYEWFIGNEASSNFNTANFSTIFDKPGIYDVILKVTDSHLDTAKASIQITAGNAVPELEIEYEGNHSFYLKNNNSNYQVKIKDAEDEQNGGIETNRALVNLSFVEDREFLNQLRNGTASLPDGPLQFVEGIRLIQGSDCLSCHMEEAKNIGPSYREVAKKYKGDAGAVSKLARKVVRGGGGVWGDKLMAGHPQLRQEEAEEMIKYILSLESVEKLPLTGKFDLSQHSDKSGGYVLSAAYKDKGANGIPPITGRTLKILRDPKVEAEDCEMMHKSLITRIERGGQRDETQVHIEANGYLMYEQIDLKGVRGITFDFLHEKGGQIEVRLDKPDGQIIGTAKVPKSTAKTGWVQATANLRPTKDILDLYFVFKSERQIWINKNGSESEGHAWHVDWVRFF